MLMVWDEGQTLATRWEHACQLGQELHPHWKLGQSYSGFTGALISKSADVVPALKRRFQRDMQQKAGSYWTVGRWQAFAVDGTRIEAPHTADNEAGLGCAGKDKTAPQVFLTTLWHLGLGLPWDFRVGPGTTSERSHARDLIDGLPEGSLLVADAGFASYAFCRKLLALGHGFILRVGANVSLLTELGYYCQEREGVVYLWPTKLRGGRPLVLRLIKLVRGKQIVCLLTNILDPEQLSDEEAARIYELRWGEEVYHRSFKQTLKRRTLLSRTRSTCLVEAEWIVLGLWLLGLMQIVPGVPRRRSPRRWSVARSRDVVRRAMRNDPPAGNRASRRITLQQALANAIQDSYTRRGSKEARNYPRKKKEKPPGAPKIKSATPREIKIATRFPPPIIPQRWTA
jgi:hypothetical protein